MDVSIVILNWNGLEFLEKCMPSVVKAARVYGHNCEIMVVDNASIDDSADYLKINFPQVKIISLGENLGFAAAMNIGIKEAKYPVVIGLNNDIIADENFILPLTSHFYANGNIFAVAAKMLLWDKKTLNFARAVGRFKFGVFRRTFQEPSIPTNTLYACGGAFAVDKDKFLRLGGFDEDMIIYWEDLDLCYRAWKQGWKTLYEPRSIIYHKFHGTNAIQYGKNWIRRTSGENYFLFMLKNIHDKTLFYQQILFLPILMLISILIGKSHFAKGLLRSLKRWSKFLEKRYIEKNKAILSDREVFRISAQ
jgi:GT2 family glycosyltransferase